MPTTSSSLFSVEAVNQLIVEPLFAESVALSSGLVRIDTTATAYYLPTVSGGTATWPSAELAELDDAGVVGTELEVTPKRISAYQVVSRQAASDANAESLIGRAMVSLLADATDKAFFNGDANGPAGLPGVAGAQSVTGDAADLDTYVDAVALVEEAGGTAGAIYVSPSGWAALSKVKESTGSERPVLSPQAGPTQASNRSLFGVPVFTSRHVPADTAWVLDPTRTVAVTRQPFSVNVGDDLSRSAREVLAEGRIEFAAAYANTVVKIAAA